MPPGLTPSVRQTSFETLALGLTTEVFGTGSRNTETLDFRPAPLLHSGGGLGRAELRRIGRAGTLTVTVC